MAVEHIEEQGRADLQLAAALALAWIAVVHQTRHLGDGAEAAATELRQVDRHRQILQQVFACQQRLAVLLEQLGEWVAAGGQQLEAVIVDRHRDRAPLVARETPGPEEADALMHEASLKGVGVEVTALAAAADLHQQLAGPGDAGKIALAIEQRSQGQELGAVQLTGSAAAHLLAQVVAEQIGEGQLAAGPGRHGAALLAGGLHLGGHLPQPHELQSPARKEKGVAWLEPRHEHLLHMAKHRPAHVAHRDGAIGGNRADLEPVEPGDGGLLDPVAEGSAIGWLPLQLAEARVGPEAIAPVLEKSQTPVPISAGQLAEVPAAAHRFPFQLRFEAGSAGQTG